ncbi:MAG TPA: LysR substrate-binding domain-containing protein, partial [Reyranella sp.]|nr:LysR substrate-binding domain-containing protein [Reyranella sp.]
QVSLTVEGQQLYAETRPALEQIAAAACAVTVRSPVRAVRINVRPSFAVRWLIPRLPDFVARHQGIEPQVLTSTLKPDHATEPFDIAIRRGVEGWPPTLKVQPFSTDELVLVAAPSLLKAKPITSAKSLAAHVFLACKTRKSDWDEWKMQVGQPKLRPARRLQFDHVHFVLQAAVDGLGFALTPRSLLGTDVAAGRLVCPLPGLTLPLQSIYYSRPANPSRETQLFADWLDTQGA